MTLHVELVVPDREIWSGSARMVVAKTLEGDLGVLTAHPPVLGILAEGSVIRILDPETSGDSAEASAGGDLTAAVSSGFLSVAEDRVSILARNAELGSEVDTAAVRAELEPSAEASVEGGEEPAEASYARARLRAAGEQA
ncbi:MAG: F0F1 ATP synthase subunit epsilon [Kitasatospora sp.]|jgi:F-type H+-transporting ATPase subunit epsilon|nr:F0F1 ATP synthase subunit epsilon [Kitasatospora sp.]